MAFAERFMLEGALAYLDQCKHAETKTLLERVIRLHCMLIVKRNSGWYQMHGVIKKQAVFNLDESYKSLVKEVAASTNEILEGFDMPGIPEIMPPIVRDYVAFNAQPNNEDMTAAGKQWDFRLAKM